MFRNIVLALFLALSPSPTIHDITSIQPLTTESGMSFCTAFSINRVQRLYLTAAHCVDEDTPGQYTPHLFSQRISIVKFDRHLDLAILRGALGTPALQLADVAPNPGEAVSVVGFVGAQDFISMFNGNMLSMAIGMGADEEMHVSQVFDMRIEPGMSGSPVFGAGGKVVSVGQMKFVKHQWTGGVLLQFLREFVGV